MAEPRDRAWDEELRRLADVREDYRAAMRDDTPPAALDAAILAVSRRAVGAGPGGAGSGRFARWGAPLATAAVIVLGVSAVWLGRDEPARPPPESPGPSVSGEPASPNPPAIASHAPAAKRDPVLAPVPDPAPSADRVARPAERPRTRGAGAVPAHVASRGGREGRTATASAGEAAGPDPVADGSSVAPAARAVAPAAPTVAPAVAPVPEAGAMARIGSEAVVAEAGAAARTGPGEALAEAGTGTPVEGASGARPATLGQRSPPAMAGAPGPDRREDDATALAGVLRLWSAGRRDEATRALGQWRCARPEAPLPPDFPVSLPVPHPCPADPEPAKEAVPGDR